MNLKEQSARGERAKRLLENSLIHEAFDAIEKNILDGIKNSLADEGDARERAYIMYRLLQNFKQQFTQAVNTGEVAKRELLEINDPSRLKRMINGR